MSSSTFRRNWLAVCLILALAPHAADAAKKKTKKRSREDAEEAASPKGRAVTGPNDVPRGAEPETLPEGFDPNQALKAQSPQQNLRIGTVIRGTPPAGAPVRPAAGPSGTPGLPKTIAPPTAERSRPQPNFLWIDAYGQVQHLESRSQTQWVWSKLQPNDPTESPVMRTWIEIKRGYRLQGDALTKGNVMSGPAGGDFRWIIKGGPGIRNPIRNIGKGQQLVAIDTQSPSLNSSVQYKDAKGTVTPVGLALTLYNEEPMLMVHPSCAEEQLEVLPTQAGGHFLYLGVVCQPQSDVLDIVFYHSPDGKIERATLNSRQDAVGNWERFRIRLPKEAPAAKLSLGALRVVGKSFDDKSPPVSEYVVLYRPQAVAGRFSTNVGVSTSYLIYKEQPKNIDLATAVLTAKAGFVWVMVPKLLDVGASAYVNLAPLYTKATTDIPSPRFYGVNGRVGFRLPVSAGATDFSLMAGGYLWGMLVPGNLYGVKYLAGPQVFFQIRNQQRGSRSWSLYAKYAPIGEKLEPSLTNREFAVGAAYQLTSPQARTEWSLALDVSDTRFTATSVSNSLQLQSVSLGLQYRL